MYDLFWDLHQQQDIGKNRARIERARDDAQAAAGEAARVDERIDRLLLLNRAIWELVRERTDLTDDDLAQRIEDIDLRDGVRDGKLTAAARDCGQCGRRVSWRHRRCIYCGAQAPADDPFGGV